MSASAAAIAALRELLGIGDTPEAQATRDRQQAAETAHIQRLVRLIRVIVRAELAVQAELPKDALDQTIRDAWATLKPFEPVVEFDDAEQQRRAESIDQLRQLFAHYFSILTLDGPQPGDASEDDLGGGHGRGNLVEQDTRHVAGLVGGRHDSSPSLAGLDSPSVGDGPGPGVDSAGAGHTPGEAS